MNYRKAMRRIGWVILGGLLVLWGVLYHSVNKKYAYDMAEVYHIGDTFDYNGCEVEVLDIQLVSVEELSQVADTLTEEEIEMYAHNEIKGKYVVVDINATNHGTENVDTGIYTWIIESGGDGNGCSILSDIYCPKISSLPAGETAHMKLFFFLREDILKSVDKYGIQIYTSLYPEVNYISYETDK